MFFFSGEKGKGIVKSEKNPSEEKEPKALGSPRKVC